MPADARAAIARAVAPALAPPDRLTVDQWADRYRRMGPNSAAPGPWKTDRVPYLREVMRAFTDPGVRRIVLKFPTQSSKTECMINCALYTAARDPSEMLWITDNVDNARDFMNDRFIPAARACPPVADRLPANAIKDVTASHVRFSGCTFHATGSNSRGNLASKPKRIIFPDEINKYPEVMGGGKEGRAIELARSRQHAYGESAKEICASTPTLEGVGIDLEYQRSDQRSYHVPCPLCGAPQVLRFGADGVKSGGRGGLRWEGGVGAELDDVGLEELVARVERTAWYECEACGGAIAQSKKAWMLARGVWVAAGQACRADPDGPLGALSVVGEAPATTTRGYWINQLYSPFRSWGAVAGDFVRLRGEPTQDFVNQVLAESWRAEAAGSTEDRIASVVRAVAPLVDEAGEYARGTVPGPHGVVRCPAHEIVPGRACDAYPAESIGTAEPLALTGAIDVQRDEVYYEVSAWGASEQRWLIDWGTVPCPSADDTRSLAALSGSRGARPRDIAAYAEAVGEQWAGVAELVTDRVYPSSETGEALPVVRWGIDSGDRTAEVYHLCAMLGSALVPMKGRDTAAMSALYAWSTAEKAAEYGIDAPLELLTFNVVPLKDLLFRRLHQTVRGLGAVYWPDVSASGGDLGAFNALCRQLTSEESVTKATSRGTRRYWQLRPGRKDNHWLDCHVMNYALALAIGLRDIEAGEGERGGGSVRPSSGGFTAGRVSALS